MAPRPDVRTYRRPRRPGWWLRNPRYFAFMLREVAGSVLALYALVYLWLLAQLPAGTPAYEAAVATLASPLGVAFAAVVFALALVHTLSWFTLVPQALPPHVMRRGVPRSAIVAGLVVAWLVASWLVAVIVFGL